MKADEYQHGGNHYRQVPGEQHWTRQWRLFGPGYFIGCATKYLERYQYKNGLEDLRKAQHFVEKLIELETARQKQQQEEVDDARTPEAPPASTATECPVCGDACTACDCRNQ